jgi:hypothetical protein
VEEGPPFEVEDEGEASQGQQRCGAGRQVEDLPQWHRHQGGPDQGVDDVVQEGFASLAAVTARVEDEDQREDEGEVKGSVPPLLQDAEPAV